MELLRIPIHLATALAAITLVCSAKGVEEVPPGTLNPIGTKTGPVHGVVAQRQMEKLGRGVVAINQGGGKVFVSWRLFGTDPNDMAFNLYRTTGSGAPSKLNRAPLIQATCYQDTGVDLSQATAYFVRPVLKGQEQEASAPFRLPPNAPARPYLSMSLKTPAGYAPNDLSVGDLDGDGEYELVVHQAGRGRDNSQRGMTDPPILEAYKLDGTFLWRINLGKNIREGAHYTQFMVYDLDGDGKAEVACKTADGTVDGTGKIIGNATADYRSAAGYVLDGPEYLTLFDGATGAELVTTPYLPPRVRVSEWGDDYGNRVDRFLACVAYLDGERPSLVMCRGYYTRAVLVAWNWRDKKLNRVWTFDSDDGTPGNRAYRGQGNHNLSVGDVDGDGKDEIVYGACCIDHDGKGLYSTGWGHGDALHLSDIDPDRPGLEVFAIHERPRHPNGAELHDAGTGKLIWGKQSPDVGRGVAMDIDPRHRGYELWAAGNGLNGVWNARGEPISERKPRSCNFGVWWDGDLLRELLNGNVISKWNWLDSSETRLLVADGCTANNGTKSTPALCADLLGDWREEVIWRTSDNQELRIYTTTIPTEHRLHTLMHDPQYRLSVAWQNVAYNQPTQPGFYLGEGMNAPPRPNIKTTKFEQSGPAQTNRLNFSFGSAQPAPESTLVTPTTTYSSAAGFGFEPGTSITARDRFVTSDKPFFFSVKLAEGNYRVLITLGDEAGDSRTTVKAEARRLMLENVRAATGEIVTHEITVNVRTPRIGGNGAVRLKQREKDTEIVTWDDKLTLEFIGARPCLRTVEIAPAPSAPTVFLAGDSTVCDQPLEPWNSWGQMLPRFFKPGVAAANYAQSGESIKSSLGAGRFAKIFKLMKPGDWLLVQFGHNDMKDRAPDALAIYRANLKRIVAQTREKGGTPVLITSMERKAGVNSPTLAGYPDTVRAVATEENVPLIDLNAMSVVLYKALGPNIGQAFVDGTHHNNYGSYELAKCVAAGILANKLSLARFLVDEVSAFNPAHPDPVEAFKVPRSPMSSMTKAEGN